MSSKSAKKSATAKPDPAKRRNIIIAAIVAAAVVAVAILIVAGSGGKKSSATSANAPLSGTKETAALLSGIPQRGNMLGNPKAPVTMYEYIDYQCPFCKEYTLTTYPLVVNDYVRPGKVRLILMPLQFLGPDSETAARAGAAAGQQNRQFQFTDLWYFNQGEENSGYVTPTFINHIFDGAGVNRPQANAYRLSQSSKTQSQVAQTGAEKYGVVSTPSFVIGKTGGPYQKLEIDTSSEAGFKAAFDTFLKG
ncbi:MAG TPA: thioredoxin domain-containing protein [Solirubrobacteraceae bacterium]|nr:thioredoxin domain-containing protein [Solirubrobacteraceae bacterium]